MFVVKRAQRWRQAHVPIEDLVQEGALWMSKAIDRFDLSRGVRFRTCAVLWIEQGMRRLIARSNGPMPFGGTSITRARFWTLNTRVNDLRHLGAEDPIGQAAAEVGASRESVAALVAYHEIGETLFAEDALREDGPSPEDEARTLELGRTVLSSLDADPAKHARRFADRFFRDDVSLQELGDSVNLSRERMRQIEADVLVRVRAALADPDPSTKGVA